MTKEVKLSQMGQTMEEGTIIKCFIKEGQKIKKDDILFEIETDKATLEMESPVEGIVRTIIAQEGQTLTVGEVLLIIDDEDEKKDTSTVISQTKQLKPTSVEGKTAAAQQGQTGYKLGKRVPLGKFGKIIAEKMLQSKREIPCFYLNVVVDVTELVSFREKLNQSANVKVSFNDFIIKALALGLKQWSIMTGRFEGDFIQLADSICIGLAVAVKDGLVAPIVKDVDKKNLVQIAQYTASLIERARSGKLLPDDIAGGCLTVSNLGSFGIDSFIPIVVPGQCSIIGVGKITDICVSQDGNIVVRKNMKLTLAVDHRIVNGIEAAQFLDFAAKLLAEPQKLT